MAEMLTKQNRKLEGAKQAQKFRKNARNKKKGKKGDPIAKVKRGEPIFLYLCECHNERAKKTPCERKAADRADRKFSESTLGTWRCSITGHKTKVKRVRNIKTQETKEISENV